MSAHAAQYASAAGSAGAGAQPIVPPRAEIERYLAYNQISATGTVAARLDAIEVQAGLRVFPRFTWRVTDLTWADGAPALRNAANVLPGTSIAQHMKGATSVALLAATAGPFIDAQVERLAARDVVGSLLWDAYGSAAVEAAADAAELAIVDWACQANLTTGWRFSPGYGDLPLSVQPLLLDLLDARKKLGIRLNEAYLMEPLKSVTALVPLFAAHATPPSRRAICKDCTLAPTCQLRAAGTPCWRSADKSTSS